MSEIRSVKIKKIAKDLNLKLLAGEKGINNLVTVEMLSRPGVEFAGFLDFYDKDRILLIGSKEYKFLGTLEKDLRTKRVENVLKNLPPAVVFSINVDIPDYFITLGNKYNIPILKSSERTTPINSKLYAYLRSALAPRKTLHGTLLDIHGMGTLIIGKSGIGKSETALELVKRGHILIADDRVDVYEAAPGIIIGEAPNVLKGFLEIRGIGIVNVMQMFGARSYRENKKVRLVIELEEWNNKQAYDRLGVSGEHFDVFGTTLPRVIIPILPGRNNATLVESAAMNEKLKFLGYNAALDLIEKVDKLASGNGENDE